MSASDHHPTVIAHRARLRKPEVPAVLDAAHLRERCSPRHVPDEIHGVPSIPYTLSAKKMEIPVRRILAGHDAATVVDRESLGDPTALDWYVAFARTAPQLAPFRSPQLAPIGGTP